MNMTTKANNSCDNKSIEKIIRIDKYARRGSGTAHKDKVKEIVGLLTNNKKSYADNPSKFKITDKK